MWDIVYNLDMESVVENKKTFELSELVFILAGLSMIFGVLYFQTHTDLVFWFVSKFFYALGVILILLNK
jgi:hypothetical protein